LKPRSGEASNEELSSLDSFHALKIIFAKVSVVYRTDWNVCRDLLFGIPIAREIPCWQIAWIVTCPYP
jgi:hypothetical protein